MDPKLKSRFKALVSPDAFFDQIEERVCYSYNGSTFRHKPDIVLAPKNSSEVAEILKLANEYRIPVIPRGAATGLSGGSIPIQGGIALAMNKMNRILDVDRENLVAEVEPGVITDEFRLFVEKQNLFYPPDPASMKMCTLGGNVAENAGGPLCLKYGVTGDYVLGLEVVLASGEVIHTGGRVLKNVTGYDLGALFIGSEGTLGVFTRIILRLIPLPEDRKTVLAIFSTMEQGARAVAQIIAARVIPATLEFMDATTTRCVEYYLHLGLPTDAEAMLVIEVDGMRETTAREMEQIVEICRGLSPIRLEFASTALDRENLWKARRAISPALGRVSPHKIMEDVVVPRSKLPDLVMRIAAINTECGTRTANFGHAGDGNLHVDFLLKERREEEIKKVEGALEKLFQAVIELGGTLSGEHGIGFLKSRFLPLALDHGTIETMRKIKQALDPNNILNPGKIFPPSGS